MRKDLKLLLKRLKTFLKVAPEFISLTDLLLTDYIAKILIILCQFYHFKATFHSRFIKSTYLFVSVIVVDNFNDDEFNEIGLDLWKNW